MRLKVRAFDFVSDSMNWCLAWPRRSAVLRSGNSTLGRRQALTSNWQNVTGVGRTPPGQRSTALRSCRAATNVSGDTTPGSDQPLGIRASCCSCATDGTTAVIQPASQPNKWSDLASNTLPDNDGGAAAAAPDKPDGPRRHGTHRSGARSQRSRWLRYGTALHLH